MTDDKEEVLENALECHRLQRQADEPVMRIITRFYREGTTDCRPESVSLERWNAMVKVAVRAMEG